MSVLDYSISILESFQQTINNTLTSLQNSITNILSTLANHETEINELKTKVYSPKPLVAFVIHDPKTRLIHKSDFRDRVIHHALVQIIEPLFDRTFIYDSYANRIRKGAIKSIERLNGFMRKVSRNGSQKGWFNNNQIKGYCLKVDIKHYFQTVDCEILLSIIKKKITCQDTINLIEIILKRTSESRERERD